MSSPVNGLLALRISRRAIASVVLTDDTITLRDSRHLHGPVDRAVATAVEFLTRLIGDVRPRQIALCTVQPDGDVSTSVVAQAIDQRVAEAGLPLLSLSKEAVLKAWTAASTREWTDVRELALDVWPELGDVRHTVKPFVLDAAALGLLAYCQVYLGTPT